MVIGPRAAVTLWAAALANAARRSSVGCKHPRVSAAAGVGEELDQCAADWRKEIQQP